MNYRERFRRTVRHQAVDRVPFDLAGTVMSSIEHSSSIDQLRQYLGISGPYDGWYDKFDERILECLDIDFRRAGDMLFPDHPSAVNRGGREYTDCWGITRVFTGLYWDIKAPPLKGTSIEDLKRYPWPDPGKIDRTQLKRYRYQAERLYKETDYVVGAEHPVFGILELGCWMCGFDEFLLKMALDPAYVLTFFDIILEYQKKVIEIYYGELGPFIHFTTSGDDFGTQTGPFISPQMFESMIKPYYAERIRYTREFTDACFFHHTCGSVFSLIPHLIDAGVELLNPIQPGARDMEPEKLKQAYGEQLTFWGGIDTQHILPAGSPAEVKQEVRRILEIMGGQGGYILAPAHNLQPDVPPENIAALFQAGTDYFRRSSR